MARFTEDETFLFLAGSPITIRDSSNVTGVQWDEESGKLVVDFYDGTWYVYRDVSDSMAEQLAAAPRKGVWVRRELVDSQWPFDGPYS